MSQRLPYVRLLVGWAVAVGGTLFLFATSSGDIGYRCGFGILPFRTCRTLYLLLLLALPLLPPALAYPFLAARPHQERTTARSLTFILTLSGATTLLVHNAEYLWWAEISQATFNALLLAVLFAVLFVAPAALLWALWRWVRAKHRTG